MKKRILCLNSEIFSPLYLDLFKNDNGNCFFPIWDFSDSCTIFSSKGREKCQAAFSTLFWHLDQISCELMIFFRFTMGPKKFVLFELLLCPIRFQEIVPEFIRIKLDINVGFVPFFQSKWPRMKESAVIFRQNADFFIQKINKQNSWFFLFLVTLTKKREMEWTGHKKISREIEWGNLN
jgi:hypothetical protein